MLARSPILSLGSFGGKTGEEKQKSGFQGQRRCVACSVDCLSCDCSNTVDGVGEAASECNGQLLASIELARRKTYGKLPAQLPRLVSLDESEVPVLSLRVGVLRASEWNERRGESERRGRRSATAFISRDEGVTTHRQSTVIAALQLGSLSLSRVVARAPRLVGALEEALRRHSSVDIAARTIEPPLRRSLLVAADTSSESSSPVIDDDAGSALGIPTRSKVRSAPVEKVKESLFT